MNKLKVLLLVAAVAQLIALSSCNNSTSTTVLGNWSRQTPFKGKPRSGAASFIIDDKLYLGLGYNGSTYFTDFYEWDQTKGFWSSKAPFPGERRERSASFSINGKGYVGTGYNRDSLNAYLGDFWEFDPAANTWTRKADFLGTPRYNAIGFAIGNKGYIGTGYDGSTNGDMFEYDPNSNTWSEIESFPGQKREAATVVVDGESAYIFGGRDNGLTNLDFYKFTPGSSAIYTDLRTTTDKGWYSTFQLAVQRQYGIGFMMNNKLYVATGTGSNNGALKTCFEYDPSNGVWTKKTDFEGSPRTAARGWVIGGRAFIGTGESGSSRFDDVWEFKPNDTFDANN
ncbi:MAG: galactose oxidase [Cyclobacteriaceae bacterium]|nr:galactose oxidase [Cyclobacteriaceae bacterium]